MIHMTYPHMALNASDVPGADYNMYNSWNGIEKSIGVDSMIYRIFAIAVTAPGRKLSTVIFNAHGAPGKIRIGAGITIKDVSKFSLLKGVVGRIIIVACNAAGQGKRDGHLFCSELAKSSGAYVTAGESKQQSAPLLPYGYIDDFEGNVCCWSPSGELLFESFYSMAWWATVKDSI